MQRSSPVIVLFPFLLFACNGVPKSVNKSADTTRSDVIEKRETIAVFPVTDYLLGQLKTIGELPVTPLKTTGLNDEIDSVWIKREDVRELAAPFLEPVIDSASLNQYFTGNSFLDQTVNAVTFTYNLSPDAPEGIALKEINVYINPATNEVERIYLLKENNDSTMQLIWKGDKWFSIRTIHNDEASEEKVIWNFDE